MSEDNGTTHEPAYRKVTISRANAFRASKWLRKNKAELLARRLTKDQIAVECAKALELPAMSAGNLEGICTDFEIGPLWVVREPSGKCAAVGMLARGQSARVVARELLNVCAEFDRICRLLGETFDPDKTIDLSALRQVVRGHTPAVDSNDTASNPTTENPESEPVKIGQVRVVP